MGLRKPNQEIYEFVIKDAQIRPESCIFIDDSLPNIEAAQRFGLPSLWAKPGLNWEKELKNLLNPGQKA